jgi:hypothetical protein
MANQKDNPTRKIKTAAAAMATAEGVRLNFPLTKKENLTTLSQSRFESAIRNWPENTKKAANETMQKYGTPNEATPTRLTWFNIGPWKYTTISRFEIPHNFPTPHTDYIKQAINYRVPVEKMCDVAAFDGSIIVDRSAGEVAARGEGEVWNFVALNLMNDIVNGKLSVKQARQSYSEMSSAIRKNRAVPYAEQLQFELPTGDTTDPDSHKI